MHEPVLLHEAVRALDPKPGEFIIDGTVDGGGHAEAIIQKIAPGGRFLGVDWDAEMVAARERRAAARRASGGVKPARAAAVLEKYACGNYADLPEILADAGWGKADGLLLDLGVSSDQLAGSGRGFSFLPEAAGEPLLMTYDDSRRPLAEFLRGMGEAELADIIYRFGGERHSRRIARAIAAREREGAITTSGELAEAVRRALPRNYERGRIDPATRTFQALRIYANGELENLDRALGALAGILRPGGRAAIISFHSLEDRAVKQAFLRMEKEGTLSRTAKKPVAPSREEVARNPRSRSAKLRTAVMR